MMHLQCRNVGGSEHFGTGSTRNRQCYHFRSIGETVYIIDNQENWKV
ncbi:MAG: hypothetical protein JW863_23180 [Chitinispirillaceae bacterium]|nr:hypothetical protein [Chitinispirillaceae bacterium]